MMGLIFAAAVIGAGAYATHWGLKKMGEKTGGVPLIGGMDARPIAVVGGLLATSVFSAFLPFLAPLGLAVGLGAAVPLVWDDYKEQKQLTDSSGDTSGLYAVN